MSKIFIVCIFNFLGIILSGQPVLIAISTFTTDSDGWEGGWSDRSTIDGISEGDWYMRFPVGINPGNRGSKLISYNPTEAWTGNFIDRGETGRLVTDVSLNFANWSESDPAYLRVAISNMANVQQSGGTWWVSNNPIYFAPESGWGTAIFQINESTMHRVGNLTGEIGIDTFEQTMSNINGFRIFSSTLGYAAIGDEFYGYVGMDNIQLISIPESSFTPLAFTMLIFSMFFRNYLSKS